jgi:hypothetical protein
VESPKNVTLIQRHVVANILKLQSDFQEQQSLVQEVIEEAGHLYIFLLKFHCELRFITFRTQNSTSVNIAHLKENMPKALTSVQLETT